MELWEALSKRRKEIGMQFTELEKETGMSISTLKKIFGGHIAAPSYLSIQAIAYAMKMTMAELDLMIAEKPDNNGPSAEALQLAYAYDRLSEHSKLLVRTVVDIESNRPVEKKKIPVIEATHDSIIHAKYNAKREVQEMEESRETENKTE